MKVFGAWWMVYGWFLWAATTQAGPAVLLKNTTAQIIRGHYLLGRRLIREGEIVTVRAIHDLDAQVTTADGDPLMVALADLRLLPASAASLRRAAPPPISVSSPTPAPAVKPIPPSAVKSADPVGGPRREVAVRCSHLTKKGTQCLHMTYSPNGLCWQHGGD